MYPDEVMRSDRKEWVVRRTLFLVVFTGLIFIPMVVIMIAGVSIFKSVVWGLMIGYGAITILTSFSELFIPKQFLRCREWMMKGSPKVFASVGSQFDELVENHGDKASLISYARIRVIGIALLLTGLALESFLWWLSSSAAPH
jgi:hypothetical protein